MTIDLEGMTLSQLEELLRKVRAEICRRRRERPPPRVVLARFAAQVREHAS
jgi:hypothetical protein